MTQSDLHVQPTAQHRTSCGETGHIKVPIWCKAGCKSTRSVAIGFLACSGERLKHWSVPRAHGNIQGHAFLSNLFGPLPKARAANLSDQLPGQLNLGAPGEWVPSRLAPLVAAKGRQRASHRSEGSWRFAVTVYCRQFRSA